MNKQIFILLLLFVLLLLGSPCSSIKQMNIPKEKSKEALIVALEQKGSPYLWGGRKPPKFDCSGLITYSYKEVLNKEKIFRNNNTITSDVTMNTLYNYNVQILAPKEVKKEILFL